jgi:hypothetical protein
MPDNIAFQPGSGNAVLHEDAETTFEGSLLRPAFIV